MVLQLSWSSGTQGWAMRLEESRLAADDQTDGFDLVLVLGGEAGCSAEGSQGGRVGKER